MEKFTATEAAALIDSAVSFWFADRVSDEPETKAHADDVLIGELRRVNKTRRDANQGNASRRAVVEHDAETMLALIDLFEKANESVTTRVNDGLSDEAADAIRNTFRDAIFAPLETVLDSFTTDDEREFARRVVGSIAGAINNEKVRARAARRVLPGIADGLAAGTLNAGQKVTKTINGTTHSATITKDGLLSVGGEKLAVSPAATKCGGGESVNGMAWWTIGGKTLREIVGE